MAATDDIAHASLSDVIKEAVREALTEARLDAVTPPAVIGGHANPHKVVHDLISFGHQPKKDVFK
jgi:hypothetical protein